MDVLSENGGGQLCRAVHSVNVSYRTPYMVANVAVRNWRFLYKLGISGGRWFEGIGNWTEVRKVATFGTDLKAVGPDWPTVLTLYVAFLYPGLPPEVQGSKGRAELLSASYHEYERRIREQFDDMFSRTGFDPKRDIAGLILNRVGTRFLQPAARLLLRQRGPACAEGGAPQRAFRTHRLLQYRPQRFA